MFPVGTRGVLFEINYISIERRRADLMIHSSPQTPYKLHFFCSRSSLVSAPQRPFDWALWLCRRNVCSAWALLLASHVSGLSSTTPCPPSSSYPMISPPFGLSPPRFVPPLNKMQYVPGNFSVHYLIVFCKYKVRLNYRWLYCLFVILLPCRATNEWAIYSILCNGFFCASAT